MLITSEHAAGTVIVDQLFDFKAVLNQRNIFFQIIFNDLDVTFDVLLFVFPLHLAFGSVAPIFESPAFLLDIFLSG